ncbi:flagellar assembly protein FliW [Actinotalea sp. K2]|uniref:flagellar assembly protein FliW n=1 Tax=Actinotalea sp. K2 TaxID=2939438 RepID=UPI002017670D|nr:flagellar assembly protein FliW [Actinotalea sp. K2]MCL3860844.1 flagellar assembly protein FliW [Actinotalea sp. K2]
MSAMVAVRTTDTTPASTALPTRPVTAVLDFVEPPLGMMGLRSFTLTALDEAGLLFALRSTEQPDVRLFVIAPQPYFPQYSPDIDPTALAALDLTADEAVLLVVVRPAQDDAPPTANLLAPVVLHPGTGRALQVVLESDEWPLRAPLTAGGSTS